VKAGKTAAFAMLGVVGMLAVAGLLEGIGRQTINNDAPAPRRQRRADRLAALFLLMPASRGARWLGSPHPCPKSDMREFVTSEGVDLRLRLGTRGRARRAFADRRARS
jgi:hypothetical protein